MGFIVVFLIIAMIVGVVSFFSARQRARDAQSIPARRTTSARPETRPDNPRFPTWDAAMNRVVTDDLRFNIEYSDRDGVVTEREITPKSIHLQPGEPAVHIVAYCHLRNEERTFHSDRILGAFNLKTRRHISNLGQYLRGRY